MLYTATYALRLAFLWGIAPSEGAVALRGAIALLAPLLELLEIISVSLFAVGLTGTYALLGRSSMQGIVGLILVYLSILAIVSFVVFAVATVTFADPGGSLEWLLFAQEAARVAKYLLLGSGVLLLAAAVFGARILGRWKILPLILGLLFIVPPLNVLVLQLFPVTVQQATFASMLASVFQGLGWVLLGSVLWVYASHSSPP
jgi:hypothetical protein